MNDRATTAPEGPTPTMKMLAPLIVACALACTTHALETELELNRKETRIEVKISSSFDQFAANLIAYNAAISVDPAQRRIGHLQFKFQFNDVKTGDRDRDKAMRDWQLTDQYPDCVYTMDSLVTLTSGQHQARGRFLFHGTSTELSFPVAITFRGNECIMEGEFPFDVRSHGLPVYRRFGLIKVAPVVQVKFCLHGTFNPSP